MVLATPPERFKTNILGLLETCKDIVQKLTDENYLVVPIEQIDMAITLVGLIPDDMLINGFLEKCEEVSIPKTKRVPYFNEILTENDTFFLKHAQEIFKGVPTETTQMFVDMFQLTDPRGIPAVSAEDKKELWKIFKSLVKIALHHIHEQRKPYIDPETKEKRYRVEFCKKINITFYSMEFGIADHMKWL